MTRRPGLFSSEHKRPPNRRLLRIEPLEKRALLNAAAEITAIAIQVDGRLLEVPRSEDLVVVDPGSSVTVSRIDYMISSPLSGAGYFAGYFHRSCHGL